MPIAVVLNSFVARPGAPPVAELFGTVHPQLGYTALHAAVDFERADCARLMLKHGADPNTTKARHRQTPLHIAAAGARVEIWAGNKNIQHDFNVILFECFDTWTSAVLRELDESHRFVQKSAESTSI